jgi:pyruvoyl-dependent arginine decarboxylase (PvlArgDC)
MTVARRKSREQEHALAAALGFDTPDGAEFIEALRTENDQLRTALRTRIVIEQAKGVLAERLGLEVDVAFERLRREARTRRMKLHAFAAAVVAREAWTEPLFQPGEGGNAKARPARATAPRPVHRA